MEFHRQPHSPSSVLLATAVLLTVAVGSVVDVPAAAQDGGGRALHQAVANALVRVRTRVGGGSGWLLERAGQRSLVITSRHVICPVRSGFSTCATVAVRVEAYRGATAEPQMIRGSIAWVSIDADIAGIELSADPPPSARPLTLETGEVARGDRVVIGGDAHDIAFQTVDATVSGVMHPSSFATWCGTPCMVADAPAFAGSTGGPVVNRAGRVVGMLWDPRGAQIGDGPTPPWSSDPVFALVIHGRTLQREIEAQAARR